MIKSAIQSGTEEERCLQDLFLTNPTDDRDAIITAKGDRVGGTCEWITSTEEYVKWTGSDAALLWVSGRPGKGKTFLSIFLTKHLAQGGRTVIYFFCDSKVGSRNTATAVLRGLIYQLVDQRAQLVRHVLAPCKVQQSALFNESSFESLWRIFQAIVEDLRGVEIYCVLDGLDECFEDSLTKILRKVGALFDRTSSVKHTLKLVIASRRHPDCLERTLGTFPQIALDSGERNDVQFDIDSYISACIQRLPSTNASLVHHIERKFREKAEGTFLWVSFMFEDLEKRTVAGIEEALRTLPQGLDGVYKRILLQIKPENKAVVADLLRWITLAIEPLSVSQLGEALRIRASEHLSRDQVCLAHITSCGHLLQVQEFDEWGYERYGWDYDRPDQPWYEGSACDPLVTLVHQSAKDFLLHPFKDREIAAFLVNEVEGNISITRRLLSSMQDEWLGFVQSMDFTSHPLAHYCFKYWPDLMRQLDDQSLLQLVDKNRSFFAEESRIRVQWLPGYDPSILHTACRLDLLPLVERLLQRKRLKSPFTFHRYINQPWPVRPLMIALERKNIRLAQLLLCFGARVDVGIYADSFLTVLEWTARHSDPEMFELLSDTKRGRRFIKSDLIAAQTGRRMHSLLHLSAARGDPQICKALIETHHYNVDSLGHDSQTPLIYALRMGNVDLAQALVGRWGASTASAFKLLEAANLLMCFENDSNVPALDLVVSQWGVDINCRDESGRTIFHTILQNLYEFGSLHSIRPFLERCVALGGDPSICSSTGDNPLHLFPWSIILNGRDSGFRVILWLLHDGRLGINDQNKEGNTLLHKLFHDAFHDDQIKDLDRLPGQVLTWLLDLGADRALQNSQGTVAGPPTNYSALSPYDQRLSDECNEVLKNYATVPSNLKRRSSDDGAWAGGWNRTFMNPR